MRSWIVAGVSMAAGAAALGILLAPYIYAELFSLIHPHAIVSGDVPKLARGRMFDDYFAVEELGDATFAIGEPRYYQGNYAYLIVGRERALLFDSGSGTRDIGPVIRSLTALPVTVVVSHLHYDHVGGAAAFGPIALLDTPPMRGQATGDRLVPGRYEHLGFIDSLGAPVIRVSEWLKPNATIDLGGRRVTVLADRSAGADAHARRAGVAQAACGRLVP